ncbi:alkaline phosphatase [Caldalkalibacillus salinus]|uniref:alkaline phosphatase n=1 Tax=Caldalkalibacillus salinus TaxID=2803787 RepID=UPI001F01C887|nr:alkaline phosphatase [Caldalkalibacillus salinus]
MLFKKRMFMVGVILLLIMSLTACEVGQDQGEQPDEERQTNAEQPKNVIVMIGDGMGVGQMEVARLFEYGKEGTLFMETLPHVALSRTYSADHIATDSGAAGTALANGDKTNNGMIGVGPDGQPLTSILDIFKDQDKTVGVVSTNTVTDATPAAYVANVEDRWEGQEEIARQILENEVDIALGGGEDYFIPENQNGKDLLAQFEDKGYHVVRTADELANVETDVDTKLLGLFNRSYMNYVGDREVLESEEPSLLEMTEKAIDTAANDEEGFFLMIEGARIDHVSHAADFGGIWREVIDFDQAVEYAVNWAEENGDTLVVVKADHETMGISATEPIDIEALKAIEVSPEYMAQQLDIDEETNNFTSESIRNVFAEYANIDLTDEDIAMFQEHVFDADDPEGRVYAEYLVGWEIGSIIAHHYNAGAVHRDIREASESTGGHTGNMVPVFAYGVGAEHFDGVLNNTEIPRIIAEISGFAYDDES